MTKKKKIIIASVCIATLLLGATIGIIIATWKVFKIQGNYNISYNDHTELREVRLPNGYIETTPKIYSNATAKIQQNTSSLYGIFSYIENDIIIPAKYTESNLKAINIEDAQDNIFEQVFRGVLDDGEARDVAFFNDSGSRLSITEFDTESGQLLGTIKEKDLSVSLKKKGVKVKTKNNFKSKKIAISDANFVVSYRRDGVYNYEVWEIVDTDNDSYLNLYQVCNGKRTLVQTLNNQRGSGIESTIDSPDFSSNTWICEAGKEWLGGLFEYSEIPLYFQKDGTPMLMQLSILDSNEEKSTITLNVNIFDIHFELEDSAQITLDSTLHSALRVGNSIYFQYTIPASENKYDYSILDGDTTKYYKLETYKLNLKSGNYTHPSFDYLIEDYDNSFNIETVLGHTRKIKNKLLEPTSLMIINDRLQTKVIDYDFEYLTRINSDRYIAHGDNGDYLIDKKYNRIAFLGNADDIFTTNDALMLTDNETGYTLVCDLDGMIVRRYHLSEIENIYNDTYYLINVEREEDGKTYKEKYLERLGVRMDTPIYSKETSSGTSAYEYNGTRYIEYSDEVSTLDSDECTRLITRIKQASNGQFTYEFYNIEGKYLNAINLDSSGHNLVAIYEDDDHILLRITVRTSEEHTFILNK